MLPVTITPFHGVTQGKQLGPVEPWFPHLQSGAVHDSLLGLLGGLREPAGG